MRSSEIRLRKLKLRLRDKRFANHKAPCTAIWQQPLQSVLALRGCSATEYTVYMCVCVCVRVLVHVRVCVLYEVGVEEIHFIVGTRESESF